MQDPQHNQLRKSLITAGLQHGQTDVPVAVGNVQVVDDGGKPLAKYCATPGHATLTAKPPPGDGAPMPLTVRVTYACAVPTRSGFYKVLGKATANGAVALVVEKFEEAVLV